MSAPEVTSGASPSLGGGASEREGGGQWGPHARRLASGSRRGLPGESAAWQVLLLSWGPGALPGVSQLGGRRGLEVQALLPLHEELASFRPCGPSPALQLASENVIQKSNHC